MATTAGVRTNRLRSLVLEERRAVEELRGKLALRRALAEKLVQQLAEDEQMLEARLKTFKTQLKKLDEWQKEPVVIVRTSPGGYSLPVYHDAKEPCGFGRNLLGSRSMLLAEAEEAGHSGCMACGYRARRRRLAVAA